MSLSVFNGLLYGGDMAPAVKQDGAGPYGWPATWTDTATSGTHEIVWQTPSISLISLGGDRYVRLDLHDAAIKDLHRVIRKWEINFLLVCTQFLVVLIAAIWGWAR